MNLKLKKLILTQSIFVTGLSILVLSLWGKNYGLSLLLGALAWTLPSFYFAWQVFKSIKTCSPQKMVAKFYLGEVLKLLLSGILLLIIIKCFSILVIPLLWGYISALLSFWILVLITQTR